MYRLNSKRGQLAGWEALIILVLLGAVGWLGYLYAHKPSENSIYQSGSKPVITDIHLSPFSCVSEGAMERRLNVLTANTQSNH